MLAEHPLRVANLQLQRYFVTQLNIIANPSFDVTKGVIQKDSDLCLNTEMGKNTDGPTLFQLKLNIKLQPSAESNLPYSVVIEIVGIFKSTFTGSPEQVERLVYVNGNSMLYGTAREIVRASTAFGPYAQILIPSVSFYEAAKSKVATETPLAPAK